MLKETRHGTDVSFPTFCPLRGVMEGVIKGYFSERHCSAWLYPMHGGRPLCIRCTFTNEDLEEGLEIWHLQLVQEKYCGLYERALPEIKKCGGCERVVDINPGDKEPSGFCQDCWDEYE